MEGKCFTVVIPPQEILENLRIVEYPPTVHQLLGTMGWMGRKKIGDLSLDIDNCL